MRTRSPLENEDESGRRLCDGVRFFRRVSKASATIAMKTSCVTSRKLLTTYAGKLTETNFDELMAGKKESAPGPDGIPYSLYKCAGGLGSPFLYTAYTHVDDGGPILALFAASRTVFFPKSSDVDNNGCIVRSPEAPRPLTLCNCN